MIELVDFRQEFEIIFVNQMWDSNPELHDNFNFLSRSIISLVFIYFGNI